MPIFNDNAESIGRTPLVKINRLAKGLPGTLLGKIEGRNPTYSVKCRIGASMIWDAEKRGVLKAGNELIEPTSGNTGIALAFVAGALSPDGDATANAGAWSAAVSVTKDLSTLPSSIQFTGQAIALFGALGETDYQLGQASVFVDGVETFDQTGIHQNETNAFSPVPDSILFAWRWPAPGPHALRFGPSTFDAKEGGPFLHLRRYVVLP